MTIWMKYAQATALRWTSHEDTADRRRKKRKEHHGPTPGRRTVRGRTRYYWATMTPMTMRTWHVSTAMWRIGQAWILLPSSAASICPPPYRHWTGTVRCCSTVLPPACRSRCSRSRAGRRRSKSGTAGTAGYQPLPRPLHRRVRRYLARRRGLPGLDGSLCSGPGGYLSRAGSGI